MTNLKHFINPSQLACIRSLCRGEEGEWFLAKSREIQKIVEEMPRPYQTENQKQKLIHLHYFTGNCDWHIIERDASEEQHQAFGYANLGYGSEMGYISIQEILNNGGELDLHWTPKVFDNA